MNVYPKVGLVAAVLAASLVWGAADAAGAAPSVAEQMAGLQQMCVDTAAARAQRQAETALYERLGGYERIHDLTREIVRRHNRNDAIKELLVGVDSESLARHVADFLASRTGGPQTYEGRTMPAAHRHLHLTDADFLSAGSDVAAAMQSLGHGDDEINEIVCILVSLKDQVVFD